MYGDEEFPISELGPCTKKGRKICWIRQAFGVADSAETRVVRKVPAHAKPRVQMSDIGPPQVLPTYFRR